MLRVAILGANTHFDDYRVAIEALADLAVLVAVAEPDPALNAHARRQAPGARVFDSADALLAETEIDLAVVLGRMQERGSLARVALAAGANVLVEKPFAATVAEGEELIALARRRGLALVPAPFVTLSPSFAELRDIVAGRQAIGEVTLARARYANAGPDWERSFFEEGAGVVLDQAVYNVTTLTGLLGPVTRVTALAAIAVPVRRVEGEPIEVSAFDGGQLLLDFASGAIGSVLCGFNVQAYATPAIELYGRDGTVYLQGEDWAPGTIDLWTKDNGGWESIVPPDPPWEWTAGLDDFVAGRPVTDPDHALHVLDVLLTAERSARERRALDVGTSFG